MQLLLYWEWTLIYHVAMCSHSNEYDVIATLPYYDQDIFLPVGKEEPPTSYTLSSIIHHQGATSGGHYTVTLFDPATKRMWNCDDSKVKPTGKFDQTTASILIYRKVE